MLTSTSVSAKTQNPVPHLGSPSEGWRDEEHTFLGALPGLDQDTRPLLPLALGGDQDSVFMLDFASVSLHGTSWQAQKMVR